MEFEVFQVSEDGSRLEVTPDKINDAISPGNVLIFIDHTKRKIYNFNGKDSSIRIRFVGARLAAGPIRGELGLSYNIGSIDEGEETNEFRDFLRTITTPGSSKVVKLLDRPSPVPSPRPARQSVPEAVVGPKSVALEHGPSNPEPEVSLQSQRQQDQPTNIDQQANLDANSIAEKFGGTPEGCSVEAMIIKDALYKYVQVQTTVFGKQVEHTRLERMADLDGNFTLDGQLRVLLNSGKVIGVQVLSRESTKEKNTPAKKSK